MKTCNKKIIFPTNLTEMSLPVLTQYPHTDQPLFNPFGGYRFLAGLSAEIDYSLYFILSPTSKDKVYESMKKYSSSNWLGLSI